MKRGQQSTSRFKSSAVALAIAEDVAGGYVGDDTFICPAPTAQGTTPYS